MRETTVETYLHNEVTKAGGTTRKWVSPGRRAVPDRIVIWPGANGSVMARVHFIETKAPGKAPRPEQLREHRRLRELGCVVVVLDTTLRVDKYVKAWT